MNKKTNKKAQALSVSIVIPVFNDEDHLKTCLEAIAKQSDMPDEVIVVDNNCTDNSIQVALQFPFVRIVSEKKQSVLYARTTGFNSAKGDILGRIDADTLITPDWVAELRNIFSDSDVAAVTGPMFFYDMPLSPHNIALDHLFKGPLYRYDKKFSFLAGNNMAIRRSAWQAIRGNLCDDKTMHEDIDMAIHLRKQGLKVVYDTRLQAGMSTRRYDDSPTQLRRYTSMMRQAFRKHNIHPVGVWVSEVAYLLGYLLLWPIRRSYNPATGRRSLKQFAKGNTPRKNPME